MVHHSVLLEAFFCNIRWVTYLSFWIDLLQIVKKNQEHETLLQYGDWRGISAFSVMWP